MVDIELRPVRVQDLELLLAWRSNPVVYEEFREQEGPLDWEGHLEWFATRPEGRRDLIIEHDGRRVGVVGLSEDKEVSIYVGEVSLWGEGVATTALRDAVKRFGDGLHARIHRDNEASKRLFERCGFEQVGAGEWLRYEFEP